MTTSCRFEWTKGLGVAATAIAAAAVFLVSAYGQEGSRQITVEQVPDLQSDAAAIDAGSGCVDQPVGRDLSDR